MHAFTISWGGGNTAHLGLGDGDPGVCPHNNPSRLKPKEELKRPKASSVLFQPFSPTVPWASGGKVKSEGEETLPLYLPRNQNPNQIPSSSRRQVEFYSRRRCEGPTASTFLEGSPRLCPHFTLFSRSPDRSAAGTGPFYKFSWHAPLVFIIKGQGLSSVRGGGTPGRPSSVLGASPTMSGSAVWPCRLGVRPPQSWPSRRSH